MYTLATADIARQRIEELHRQAASYRLTARRNSGRGDEIKGRRTFGFVRRVFDRHTATV
jgi:hypothetical protein